MTRIPSNPILSSILKFAVAPLFAQPGRTRPPLMLLTHSSQPVTVTTQQVALNVMSC